LGREDGHCRGCQLRRRVDTILGPAVDGPTAALRDAILAARLPEAALHWLDRGRTTELLGLLAPGRRPISHATLDDLPAGPDVEHVRALLVAAEALPPDPRAVTRLEAVVPALLAKIDPPDRSVVAAWVQWSVLPRIRRRAQAGRDVQPSVANARRLIVEVIRFLDYLRVLGRSLAACLQADLDNWFALPGASRATVRPFLVWARRRHHMPQLTIPARPRGTTARVSDPEDRWALARRLVNDDTFDEPDRFAAALVVLYAQPLSRIVTLTTADITAVDSGIYVTLGADRIQLPTSLADIARRMPRRRRNGVADQLSSRWLFPSSRAGQHISATALGNRVRAIGVEPRAMRLAALYQLTGDIPPALLAPMLGISAGTADRWSRLSRGDYANYAADRHEP
jgi:hypothetical protein